MDSVLNVLLLSNGLYTAVGEPAFYIYLGTLIFTLDKKLLIHMNGPQSANSTCIRAISLYIKGYDNVFCTLKSILEKKNHRGLCVYVVGFSPPLF